MELRYQRERDFHDKAFSEETRRKAHKFYSVARSSKTFYEDFLRTHCVHRSVLEYGCGRGSRSFFLAQSGATVIGIDISDIAIEQARETAACEQLDKATFRVMNAEALDFEDNTFDLICGSGILHHLNLHRAFLEVTRTLKPDGAAIFFEPLGHNPIINLYRRLTPHMRTEDENPLLMKDLTMTADYFETVKTQYFHLCSLTAAPFRNLLGFKHLLRALDGLDGMLFKLVPPVRRYAWIVILILSRPRKIRVGTARGGQAAS